MYDPVLLPTSAIESGITDLRRQKVMIDADLAELYGSNRKRALSQNVHQGNDFTLREKIDGMNN